MDYAVDMGINFFDTAEMYAVPPKPDTQGSTEEIIGTWFKKPASGMKLFWRPRFRGARLLTGCAMTAENAALA